MNTVETYHPVLSNTSSGMFTFSKVLWLLLCLILRDIGSRKTEDIGDEITNLAERVKSSPFVAAWRSEAGP